MIAAKAVALREAFSESFRRDQAATRRNARRLAATLERRGYRIISGGTDTHMFLMDVFQKGMTGQQAETILGEVGIAVNKNAIPFDANPPLKASGVRIGTPSVTTRGMSEPEMDEIGSLLADVLESQGRKDILDRARVGIANLCHRFPFYQSLRGRATRSSTPETRG